jgi:outer membrane lipoprotein-sorting protein
MMAAKAGVFALTAALSAAVFVMPAYAASKTPSKTAPVAVNVDEAVRKAEDYLNGLKTIRSGFQQVVKGQGVATGTFYLKKPGRFLWAYNYPGQERLISTGKNLYFYEEDSQQVTELPRNTPMVKLMGVAKVSLKEAGFKVDKATRHDGRLTLALSLYDKEADLSTNATLVFIEKPKMRLEKFISTNQLNQKVEVSFFGYEENVVLEDVLFKFTPTIKKNSNEAY